MGASTSRHIIQVKVDGQHARTRAAFHVIIQIIVVDIILFTNIVPKHICESQIERETTQRNHHMGVRHCPITYLSICKGS